jgi:hypothetical protein
MPIRKSSNEIFCLPVSQPSRSTTVRVHAAFVHLVHAEPSARADLRLGHVEGRVDIEMQPGVTWLRCTACPGNIRLPSSNPDAGREVLGTDFVDCCLWQPAGAWCGVLERLFGV